MSAAGGPAGNITRDGIEVLPGQLWADLDKRMDGRVVVVQSVKDGRAHVRERHSSRRSTISVSRMHHHSTGFRLVDAENVRHQARLTNES